MKQDAEAIRSLLDRERVDILCLQETKLQTKGVTEMEEQLALMGWHVYWSCSMGKLGYSGTAIISR